MCKKIHRGGNAEQYHADKKYKEAVAVAVEACADDTKGQTCYICTQALHWKTKEGLVRMCACRGTSGFAHVSCLAEQAKILVAEAEENNWDFQPTFSRYKRWYTCRLCEQHYREDVRHALGWACWKTYLSRPETDWPRTGAMTQLGLGLNSADKVNDALMIFRAQSAILERLDDTGNLLVCKDNLALCYSRLHLEEKALPIRKENYANYLAVRGQRDSTTLLAAHNLACSLRGTGRFDECLSFLREILPIAKSCLGADHALYLNFIGSLGTCVLEYNAVSRDDLSEAVAKLEDGHRRSRRVLGPQHPGTLSLEHKLAEARWKLRTH